jgi:hypothetical protein
MRWLRQPLNALKRSYASKLDEWQFFDPALLSNLKKAAIGE